MILWAILSKPLQYRIMGNNVILLSIFYGEGKAMKVFNPTGKVRKKSQEKLLLLDELRGKTIGLVDDGWGGNWCHQFFEKLGELFTEKCGAGSARK